MYKLTICCMLIVVLATAAQATNRPRPRPVCVGRCTVGDLRRTDWVCTRDARTNLCTRLRPCRLRERNCALSDLGLKPLRQTSLRQCANVRGIEGTARCAPTRNPPRVRSCVDRSCVNQRPNSCWRTRDGRNLWLSICDARRVNCVNRNKPLGQLVRVQDIKCRIKPVVRA
ncbi:uncharacterized protein LOC6584295 [Drosophila mojavensis]|uniref:Uncharacterized protein n=1 Tax=Drosophila mojavensis TaxID=7230 RepID=B4L3Z0_DROMO|nr:uncharacterized protein LOC6584295 [Drosophila mojavensis]EDW07268.1 uncharacterized protein Dmoj_GI15651 [Drosophila mojavensis]